MSHFARKKKCGIRFIHFLKSKKNSSIGRAKISKPVSCAIESLFSCHDFYEKNRICEERLSIFSETLSELKKAIWPTQKDLGTSTIVVIGNMLLISFYQSIIDFLLFNVMDFTIKYLRD